MKHEIVEPAAGGKKTTLPKSHTHATAGRSSVTAGGKLRYFAYLPTERRHGQQAATTSADAVGQLLLLA